MAHPRNIGWWMAAALFTLVLAAYFGTRFFGSDRSLFVPGAMTSGHHQIELACNACHTPFGGVRQDSCNRCHGQMLAAVEDSHPKKKFDDPRNADRLGTIDARWCVTCHVEHRPARTRAMGVTQPTDYCVYCHKDIARERPSHKGMAFNTCASAGCHNYHNNRALYEEFLVKHLKEPDVLPGRRLPGRDLRPWIAGTNGDLYRRALSSADADAPQGTETKVVNDWLASRHAVAGVNCSGCHQPPQAGGRTAWQDKPGEAACVGCHAREQEGFLAGKHGMRLAQKLPPMRPELARLPMKSKAHGRELGCTSCHDAHRPDMARAAVEACLECHNDRHSLAYRESPHARLWRRERAGRGAPGAGAAAGSGVSCATCHLPREHHRDGGRRGIRVQHNQNGNLRPNEKMARSVCMNCHGLGFTLDALADAELVQGNFKGRPARHVQSLDMAERREQAAREARRAKAAQTISQPR